MKRRKQNYYETINQDDFIIYSCCNYMSIKSNWNVQLCFSH